MTRRTTAVPITVLLALLAVGCSDDDTAADPPTTPSVSESEPTRTTGPPSTTSVSATVSPTTPPPTTATTTLEPVPTASPTATAGPTTPPPAGEDWGAIVQGLENTRVALYEAPDPARAREMCAASSVCEGQLHAQFTDMANRGHRVVESPPNEVVSAELVPNSYDGASIADSSTVSVDVVFRVPDGSAGRIVDSSGATVFNITYTPPPGQTYTSRMTLFRGSLSEPWRESSQEIAL